MLGSHEQVLFITQRHKHRHMWPVHFLERLSQGCVLPVLPCCRWAALVLLPREHPCGEYKQLRVATLFPGHGGAATIIDFGIPVAMVTANIWRKKEQKRRNEGGSMRNGAIGINLGSVRTAEILPVTSSHNHCINVMLQSHYDRCRLLVSIRVIRVGEQVVVLATGLTRANFLFFWRRFDRFWLTVNISACGHAHGINCDVLEGWPRVTTDSTYHHRGNGSPTHSDTSTQDICVQPSPGYVLVASQKMCVVQERSKVQLRPRNGWGT
jgi:hypothetical protein